MEFPFLEQYRIEKDKPQPWKIKDPEALDRFWKLILKACLVVFINVTIVNGIGLSIYAYLFNWNFTFIDARIETIPDPWTSFKHVMICIMCEDFWFYWLHRMLHCKDKRFPLYQMVHKMHHEFKDLLFIGATYAHPIESFLSNSIPFYSGPFLLGTRFHFTTLYLWAFFRFFESYDAHSGYEFPWSICRIMPFSGDATAHQFHHTDNVGNYGTFTNIWDILFDTTSDFYVKYPEGAFTDLKKSKSRKIE